MGVDLHTGPTPGTTRAPNLPGPHLSSCWHSPLPLPPPSSLARTCLVRLRPWPAQRPGLPQGELSSPVPSTKVARELPMGEGGQQRLQDAPLGCP